MEEIVSKESQCKNDRRESKAIYSKELLWNVDWSISKEVKDE